MKKHGLSGWTGGLDNARRRFGVCRFYQQQISLSRVLCELNSEEEVRDTILHEIAHALAWERYGESCGHDRRWKAICVEIGARPVACYDSGVVQPTAPWALVHRETGEVFYSYHKRPRRDWSKSWIRGRKSETLGFLEIRASASVSFPEKNSTAMSTDTAEFTSQSVGGFREKLLDHVNTFARDQGLTVSPGASVKYDANNCQITLTFSVPEEEGVDRQRLEFEALAGVFDLKEEDYQRTFRVNGTEFQLIGFKLKNRKYPVIATDPGGRKYKFELSVLEKLKAT
ncbi:hypothetical protein AB833_20860 [Chromatiales bacterium (ex Bugula neritina AB1)]|nr:hypothetical protein AB833_20860 [Chromatiales bacterium (ex Bugula neritina AB1)]